MDEIELIKQLRANLPGARAEGREAARAALLEKIAGTEGAAPLSWRRQLRTSGRRRLAIAIGTVALAAVAVQALLLSGEEGEVQSAAAQVLQREAGIAGTLSATAPPPGQYLFTRSKEAHLAISFREGARVAARLQRHLELHPNEGVKQHIWWAYVPVEREMWLNSKGSGSMREVSGEARFLSARQRSAWIAAGSPPLPRAGQVRTERFGRHGLSGLYFSRFSRLPTEPHELRRWIEAHEIPGARLSTAGTTSIGTAPVKSDHAKTFASVSFLLGETFAPPALRAALYGVASELPGVQLLGTVTDPVGRKGIGVAYADPRRGERLELVFDPSTSTLLGERWTVTSSKRSGVAVPEGTVFGYTANLTSRVIDSASVPSFRR